MKNLYPSSIVHRLLFVVLVSSAFFLSSCSGVISSLDQYSGETLYESAIESDGDLLSFVPDIQAEVYQHLETKKQERQFMEFQRDIVTKLVKENPQFVEEFQEKMHSNDQEKIHEALREAGSLLEKELQEFTGKSNITAENVVNAVLEENSDT